MGRSLINRFLNVLVATEAHIGNAIALEKRRAVLVVHAVTRAAANVVTIVRTAHPGMPALLFVVTLQTKCSLLFRSDTNVLRLTGADVLRAVAMTCLAACRVRTAEKLHSLSVNRCRERRYHVFVTLLAAGALGDLQRRSLRMRGHAHKCDADGIEPPFAEGSPRPLLHDSLV